MNRDHFLYLLIGALGGFITGYLLHEAMALRQPSPQFSRGAQIHDAPAGAQSTQAGSGATQGSTGQGNSAPMAAMEEVQRLRAHVESNPQDLPALRQLANLNYDISNWQRASDLYQRYLEQSPGDVDVMTDLGACLRNLGKAQEALELFQEVSGLAPSHWQSKFNQVLILAFDLRDLPAARTVLDDLRALQPTNPDVQRLATEVEKLENA